MCIYIGIADLAANALIELVERKGSREVLFRDLNRYGTEVVKVLNGQHEEAALRTSGELTSVFLQEYKQYFELYRDGISEGIKLREKVDTDSLWMRFRGCLSVDVMLAFMCQESVSALGV